MSALELEIRRLIREELRSIDRVDREYRSAGPLPPGIKSREHFATVCRTLHVGRKEGHEWVVAATEWHEARAAKRSRTVSPRQPDEIDAVLAAAPGIRLLRGPR